MNPAEYATMFDVEDRHWWYRALRALIQDALGESAPHGDSRVLDIGCGTGANLASLGLRGVGIDRAPEALGLARERGLTALCQADAASLPFPDGHFSVALLTDVLYHTSVPDKLGVLREAARVLQPGGTLILNVPAYQWLYSAHDRAIHTDRRFTRAEVALLLQDAGFAIRRLTYWNTLLFPAVAAIRVLDKLRPDNGHGSDLTRYRGGIAEQISAGVLGIERHWLRRFSLPFGVSIFAVAQKSR